MKNFIRVSALIVGILIIYLVLSKFLGGYPIGVKQGRLVIFRVTCADICPPWRTYKRFYGEISQKECIELGGKPRLVGYIKKSPDGSPGPGSVGGYDGCQVQ